jgi:D-alanyl-D-alanine carboxypeptidase (penicillin-binding protein 5/6)
LEPLIMMMVFTKRWFKVFLGLFVACTLLYPGSAPAAKHKGHARTPKAKQSPIVAPKDTHVFGNLPVPFGLDARAALMIDARTGVVLYAYNEHERMQPASLAKLMTVYLTLEALHTGRITLDTSVTVSEKAWRLSMNSSVSRMFLRVGQGVPVRDLLYGLMVSSGNDAAVALAEYLAGSSDAFAAQMNAAAIKLGLTESHFVNPDGLPMPGEFTTAADMVKLARAIVERFPDVLTYTSTKEFTFDKIKQPNFNSLLFHDSRVDGLKTGHVAEAGYHLVATAHDGGMRLISAVLGTPSAVKRRTQSEKLLDWGFRSFATASPDWHKVMPATLRVYEGKAEQVAIAPVQTPHVTILKGQGDKVNLTAVFHSKYLVAPVAKDETVGVLTVAADGKQQLSIPIRTQEAVGRGGFFKRISDRIRLMF